MNGTLVEGNVAQCASVLATDTSFTATNSNVVAGQYALAAVDGSNATEWQPLTNASSTMTVDLGVSTGISALHFNWGKSACSLFSPLFRSFLRTHTTGFLCYPDPPISFVVSGGSSLSNQTALAGANVSISAPYNNVTADAVATKVGNLTDVALNSTVSVRFVNLTITGSFLGDGKGATVAEFAVRT